jgi:hypothetical protein
MKHHSLVPFILFIHLLKKMMSLFYDAKSYFLSLLSSTSTYDNTMALVAARLVGLVMQVSN